jgi:hypothetical protein
MTTGQPIRIPSDRNKYNNEFMESLQLQIDLNQKNLEVNRLYKETGQLPASTQMMDTRSNEEKLMDVEKLKQSIISDLAPIAEPMFATSIIQGVINSPLNVNNSLFRYFAQNASSFATSLSQKYKFGIAGDANDVEIIVQFLEDIYNKTKNNFQSIKSYINSNTNEGNRTISNVLSANDTDNIKTELQDLQKRLAYYAEHVQPIENGPGGPIQQELHRFIRNINTIEGFLPTSRQMDMVIKDLTERIREGAPYPQFENDLLETVLAILKKLPKLSSLQTLADRMERAIRERDVRSIQQCIIGIDRLFDNINNNPTVIQELIRFRTVFLDRADQEIQEAEYVNQVQSTNRIAQEDLNRRMERNAQRVYVVNPADDAVHVQELNGGPGLGLGGPGLGGPILAAPPPVPAPVPAMPAGPVRVNNGQLDQRQWGDYVQQMVMALSDVNLDALYRGIPNDPNLKNIDALRYQFNDPNATQADKQRTCIQALTLNFGNNRYGPHAGVGNILHNRALGLGLSKPVKKGKGISKGKNLFVPFGNNEINFTSLEKDILSLRRKSKSNLMGLPSKHISKPMKNIVNNIIGGKVANYNDIQSLTDDEKNYLHKIVNKSNLQDRLSVPSPSKDQAEKDKHEWEVMQGEILAGNDSHELVKKFKILTLKLTRQKLLPRTEVNELLSDLCLLGY